MKKMMIGLVGMAAIFAAVPETMAGNHCGGNDGLRLAAGIVHLVKEVLAPTPAVVTTPTPIVVAPPAPVVVTPPVRPVVVTPRRPVIVKPQRREVVKNHRKVEVKRKHRR